MTTEITNTLENWLTRQRPSLRAQVEHLGGIDHPAIRPLLFRQMERDAQAHLARTEISMNAAKLREEGMRYERW